MNTTKKLAYSAVASTLLLTSKVDAAINLGSNNIQENIKGSGQTADKTIQNLIGNAMMFLALLAVCYGLYGGFLMMTAGGDDKKVGQGKTILIQVGIGLLVIFLANSIVAWVIGLMQNVQ